MGQFIGLNALSQQTYDGFTLGIQMQSALLIHFVSPSNKTVNFVAFPTKVSFVLCHSATSSNTDSLVKNLVHKFVVHFLQCACFDREHHKVDKTVRHQYLCLTFRGRNTQCPPAENATASTISERGIVGIFQLIHKVRIIPCNLYHITSAIHYLSQPNIIQELIRSIT